MGQSEIFLYSLKPSALNYDWPPKFLVRNKIKVEYFFSFEPSNFPFENARRFHPFFVLSFFFRSKNFIDNFLPRTSTPSKENIPTVRLSLL